LLSLLVVSCVLMAQTYPREGSKLNYRIIGFSFPATPNVNKYTVEIADGSYDNEDQFKKHITQSEEINGTKAIIEVPAFNAQYTWRITYKTNRTKATNKSDLHHFSIGSLPNIDTNRNRLRVTTAATKYKDAFVFIDAIGVLYDMSGNPVWYLPHLPGTNETVQPRDLKLSPFGTLTFLLGPVIYEINYDGSILWTKQGTSQNKKGTNAPNNDYHHEFTRLSNGHYMALGFQNVLCKFPHSDDDNLQMVPDNGLQTNKDTTFKKGTCGNLTEYDEKGRRVWVWDVYRYILSSDLIYLFNKIGRSIDLHDNAFFFDEKNKHIFISFKNINRVIEIKYPEGNVINTYGKIYDNSFKPSLKGPFGMDNDNGLFCLQHACKLSQKGYLYLFDNGCDPNGHSKVLMIDQTTDEQGQMKAVWEYDCDNPIKHLPMQQRSGGNVIELPDGSLFVAMDMQYSEVFIVNMEKEILWSAVIEAFEPVKKIWRMNPSYRASIITTRKDLEQLIWNSEKNEQKPEQLKK